MKILALAGDGIGPEITSVTLQILERLDRSFGLGLRLESHEVGFAALERAGSTLPDPVVAACRAADGFILGPVSHLDYPPRAQGGRNPSGDLRIALDLYANVRPSRSYEGVPHWGRTPNIWFSTGPIARIVAPTPPPASALRRSNRCP